MRKSIFTITAILTICAAAAAQPDTLWTKTFGGIDYDDGCSVQQTTDGGYIIAGTTLSYGTAGSRDVYLIKTDASGDTVWTKTFGGSYNDYGESVQQTSDGGYLIAGSTSSYGAGYSDVYLIKTNASGIEQWYNTFGGIGDDGGYSIQQTSDGGNIITGSTNSFEVYHDVYLIKTDANGDLQWDSTLGWGYSWDTGYSVQQTNDGGYIIVGSTHYGDSDVYLIKTTSNGSQQWYRTFGGSGNDIGHCVRQTNDGGYIIVGGIYPFGAGSADVYLIKTDASGDSLWTKTFGGSNSDYGRSVQQTSDGGYIIAGFTSSYGAGNDDVYLIKTDASGDSVWTKTIGGSVHDDGNSVQQTRDGGYIIAGNTASYGAGGFDVYLIRLELDMLYLTPDMLAFPDLEIGYQDSEPVYIINPTSDEITVDMVSNSLAVFSFDPDVIGSVVPADDSLEVWVYFTPDSSTQYSDTLYVEIEDVILSAVLSGTGIGGYMSLSADSLDFGLWEPNAPYPTRNFSIENLGNDTLEVDSMISGNPAFILSSGMGLTLLPGETSNPVNITFQPPGEGFHEGYILLPNNAYNVEDDTAMVYVSGWWEYTPAPVYDLTVGIEGVDAVLNWSPVDTSIYGNPITVDIYLVYYSELPYAPDSLFFFHGGAFDTTYTHNLVVQFSETMFYQVEAYVGEIGILDEITAGDEPISRTELLELLRE